MTEAVSFTPWHGGFANPIGRMSTERLPGMLAPLPIPIHFDEPAEKSAVEQAIVRGRSGPWLNTWRGKLYDRPGRWRVGPMMASSY